MAPPTLEELDRIQKYIENDLKKQWSSVVGTYLMQTSLICSKAFGGARQKLELCSKFAVEVYKAYAHYKRHHVTLKKGDASEEEFWTMAEAAEEELTRQVALHCTTFAYNMYLDDASSTMMVTEDARPGILQIGISLTYTYPEMVIRAPARAPFKKIKNIGKVASYWFIFDKFVEVRNHLEGKCGEQHYPNQTNVMTSCKLAEFVCHVHQRIRAARKQNMKEMEVAELKIRKVVHFLEMNPYVADLGTELLTQYTKLACSTKDKLDDEKISLFSAACLHVARRMLVDVADNFWDLCFCTLLFGAKNTVYEVEKVADEISALVCATSLQSCTLNSVDARECYRDPSVRKELGKEYPCLEYSAMVVDDRERDRLAQIMQKSPETFTISGVELISVTN